MDRAATPPDRKHPAFRPYGALLESLGARPSIAALDARARMQGLAGVGGRALRFVAAVSKRMPALEYERSIVERGEIPTRAGSAHDAWNALAWLAFPRTKLALSMLHVACAGRAGDPQARAGRRGAARDAATLLDESGALVICPDRALVELWRAREWRALFHEREADVERCMRIGVIGHGVLERLAFPFPGLTLRVLVIEGDPPDTRDAAEATRALDDAGAAWLARRGEALVTRELLPLPVAAWPGWEWEGRGPRRFDDRAVYRPHHARNVCATECART